MSSRRALIAGEIVSEPPVRPVISCADQVPALRLTAICLRSASTMYLVLVLKLVVMLPVFKIFRCFSYSGIQKARERPDRRNRKRRYSLNSSGLFNSDLNGFKYFGFS